MKKILITALVLAGFSATAQVKVGSNPTTLATDANFQVEATDGTQFFINKPNGNVGIGTTTPSQRLEINEGNVNVIVGGTAGPTQKQGYILSEGATKLGEFVVYRDGSNDQVRIGSILTQPFIFNTNSTERMRITSTGNVGIGTTTPTAKLQVTSAAGSAAIFTATTGFVTDIISNGAVGSNYGESITAGTNASDMSFQVRSGFSAPYFAVRGDGNVGIGTTTPTEKLEVLGSIKMVDGNQAAGKLMVSDAAGKATWTDAATAISGALSGAGADTTVDAWVENTGNTVVSSGNVGIGTTTPAEKLEVNGNIKLTSGYNLGIMNNSGFGIIRLGSNMPNLLGESVPTFQGAFISIDPRASQAPMSFWVKQANSSSENQAMVISNTGNVGIGTSTPSEKLHVIGNIGVPDGSKLINVGGTQSYYTLSSATSEIGYQSTLNFRAFNANSPVSAMFMSGNGNVGIGTTTPATKLDVYDGSVNVSVAGTAGPTQKQGFILSELTTKIGEFVVYRDGSNDQVRIGSILSQPFIFNTNSIERMRINAIGNVGIGTTSPTAKLHVISTTPGTVANFLGGADNTWTSEITGSGTSGASYGQIITAGSTSADISLWVRDVFSAPLFFVRGDGKVGIGTTAPTSKLQVVGLPGYASDAAAGGGGLTAGAFYQTSGHATLPNGVIMVKQ